MTQGTNCIGPEPFKCGCPESKYFNIDKNKCEKRLTINERCLQADSCEVGECLKHLLKCQCSSSEIFNNISYKCENVACNYSTEMTIVTKTTISTTTPTTTYTDNYSTEMIIVNRTITSPTTTYTGNNSTHSMNTVATTTAITHTVDAETTTTATTDTTYTTDTTDTTDTTNKDTTTTDTTDITKTTDTTDTTDSITITVFAIDTDAATTTTATVNTDSTLKYTSLKDSTYTDTTYRATITSTTTNKTLTETTSTLTETNTISKLSSISTSRTSFLSLFENFIVNSTITSNSNSKFKFKRIYGFSYLRNNYTTYYITDYDDNKIDIFNENWQFLESKSFTRPAYMTTVQDTLFITADSQIYQTDKYLNLIRKLSGSANYHGIYYNSSNSCLIVASSNSIYHYSLNLTFLESYNTQPHLPYSVQVFNEKLYVGTTSRNLLVIVDKIIIQTIEIFSSNCVVQTISSILFDSYGYMMVTSRGCDSLTLYYPNGTFTGLNKSIPTFPGYIGYDIVDRLLLVTQLQINIY